MRPRRVVLDTNVLVGYLATGRDSEVVIARIGEVKYLSAVVIKELRQGIADSHSQRREYDSIVRSFERAQRILVPGWRTYEAVGRVLREMREAGYEWQSASAFGDVIIALSAKEIGATVVTRDRDFERIGEFASFSLEVLGRVSRPPAPA
jgi:predicted nucleic acid-binding protein